MGGGLDRIQHMPRKSHTAARVGRNRGSSERATLLDICGAAGVSKATISNVLNDKPGVGPELRKKLRR